MEPDVLERLLVLRLEGRTGWVASRGLVDVLLDLRGQVEDAFLMGAVDDRLRTLAYRTIVPASEVEALIRDVLRALDRVDRRDVGLAHRRRWSRSSGV